MVSQTITVNSLDPVAQRTKGLIERFFPQPRDFGVRLWDGTEIPTMGPAKFILVLKTPGSLQRMFRPPIELSLGEAFINNEFDIEGEMFSAFPLMESLANHPPSISEIVSLGLLALPTKNRAILKSRGLAHLHGSGHPRQPDLGAAQVHHDAGTGFYKLWLDKDMQYSCGYFPTGTEDLNVAQQRKMEHICRKLRLKPGERLLDLGCGWGGLARYAALKFGVEVLGLTLSQTQKTYADEQNDSAGLCDQVTIRALDYRELDSGLFDKVLSVGMFEHFGRMHLPEYFGHIHRLLKPGGLFLNHGISRRTGTEEANQGFVQKRIFGRGTFLQSYIFPDAELIPVSEVNLIAEGKGFEVRDVENLREHYALTLRHWVNRLTAQHVEILKVADEATYRTWRLYMSASAYGFDAGNLNVNQTLFAKLTQEGKSNVPYSRDDLYTS